MRLCNAGIARYDDLSDPEGTTPTWAQRRAGTRGFAQNQCNDLALIVL